MKPTLFIGSSGESLPVAEAIHSRLENDAIITLWDTGEVFTPNESALKSLVDSTNKFDFAVFVFAADDVTISRDIKSVSPRDNVVFELGLFMGKLGQHRTFVVYDKTRRPKLPSDLAGITVLTYPSVEEVSPLSAAVNAASVIRRRIRELGRRNDSSHRRRKVYWCGPVSDGVNTEAKAALDGFGFTVKLPEELVFGPDPNNASDNQAAIIQKVCREAIDECDVLVVNLDSYGLDSAWEMGYAEALGKPVVGYNRSEELLDVRRTVNKWAYSDNYMHGWHDSPIFDNLDQVIDACAGKITYLFCPYKHTSAIEAIKNSSLERQTKKLIISNRDLGIDPASPATYSWRARKRALQLLHEAEIILTVLPRYGMDTAWKLGYAAALGKPNVGWLTEEFGEERATADFLDHWMHGWRKKPVVSTMHDLAALIRGLDSK